MKKDQVSVEIIGVNGAVNNVELLDMSPLIETPFGSFTSAQLDAFYDLLKTNNERNVCETKFKVLEKKVFEGSQKFKQNTKEPILDGEGNPTFYADSYFVVVDAKGKQLYIRVKRDEFEQISVERLYLFKGFADWITKKDKEIEPYWGIVYNTVVIA